MFGNTAHFVHWFVQYNVNEYCEINIFCGAPIFVHFVVQLNHEYCYQRKYLKLINIKLEIHKFKCNRKSVFFQKPHNFILTEINGFAVVTDSMAL